MKSVIAVYRNNRFVRIFLQLVLLVVIYWSVSYWLSKDLVRGEAPNIYAHLLSGETFELYKAPEKPTLVHFWATWCPVCELENSNIQSLVDDYNVITIASWSEGARQVRQYMQEQNLSFPVIIDEDGEWAKLYNIKGVPASFFIDGNRQIKMIERGYTTSLGFRLRLWWLSKTGQ